MVEVQLDEALLEQQRAAYAVKGVDESEPAQPTKKRKKQVYTNGEDVRLSTSLPEHARLLNKLIEIRPYLGRRRTSHN